MTENKTYDPYQSFLKLSSLWEKQMNAMLFMWTNNSEFVKLSNLEAEYHSKYVEFLRKNQELIANVLNIPTKSDVANVAKLTIQAEHKLDNLEEHIWSLQDSLSDTNKDVESMIDVSKDIIKLTKQLKTEMTRTKKELAESKKMSSEIQEIKEELSLLKELKDEWGSVRDMILEKQDVTEKQELVESETN
ncbi:polyhydroxyalkanoate biosynthesis repressor PhaR [Bacillus sp. HMF5848]|uniref:polyhydroxyalkanoate biosynthesis repressor PhaR n=1 Tax=Bacillus sp. HMF5848 TaxID=2495421 RepID=UPI000F7BA55B|nr:polyhydroxyalkanoate biosynthesis repressor PhaR [Bacillus sp. HMF5848]RSK26624.1 polyhydroxyalkanoate biosynthesis repressor PhaR [Bacillus sp. HMF5848]